MPDPRLLRTPLPECGEHYLGYVLRLARRNGHLGLRNITDETGVEQNRLTAVVQAWITGTLDLTPLSRCTGHNKERLGKALLLPPHPASEDMDTRDWRLRNFRTTMPRLCPQCLVAKPFIKAVWDLTPLTYCPEHRLALVDQCPQCGRRLSWSRPSPTECQCGFDYRQAPAKAVDSIAMEYLSRNGLIRNAFNPVYLGSVEREQLKALHRVAARLYRPMDLIPASPDFNIIPNRVLHALYTQASVLRCRPDAWRTWQQTHQAAQRRQFPILSHCVCPRTTPRPDRLRPLRDGHDLPRPPSMDDATAVHIPVTNRAGTQLHQQYGVSPLRWKAAQRMVSQHFEQSDNRSAEAALARQIDLASLAKALSVKPADIHSMSANSLVHAVHADTPRYADWLYDMADVEQLFASLPIQDSRAPAVTISLKAVLVEQNLIHHNTTLGRLLKAVFIGSLPMWQTSAAGLERFLLDAQQLNLWLADELERPLVNYNLTMLARLLNTHPPVISALSKLGFLPLQTGGPGYSKRDYRIAYDTVCEFRERYILLNGIAHGTARRLQKLRANIDEQGIRPSFSRTRGSTTVVLYERRSDVVKAIRQTLGAQVDTQILRLLDAPLDNRAKPSPSG